MKRKLLFGLTICLAMVGMTLAGGATKTASGCGLFRAWGGCGWYASWCRPVVYRSCWSCYPSCGWCGCGCCGCYSCCCASCCDCCYTSCCATVDSCGCGTIDESWGTPVETAPAAPTKAQPTPAPDAKASAQRSALLNVHVPANAKVFVNSRPTTSMGADRQYVSHGLKPGSTYRYVLRAETVRDGQKVTRTKIVSLAAGQRTRVTFDFDADADRVATEPVATTLKVHVPKDAKVYLSGSKTHSTGTVREYTTSRLTAGQEWQSYEIRVEAERGGRKLTQTKVITLVGGKTQELHFDLNAPQIASLASR